MSGKWDLCYLEEYILSVHKRSQRGAGGNCPHAFRSFVGTHGVSRQSCHLYDKVSEVPNKILKEITVLECKNARKKS